MNYNTLQIDTTDFANWTDGISTDNRSSPYAGIVIDPFSDPADYDGVTYKMYAGLESYYLPGMSRSGSTSVQIHGCSVGNFVVGVMLTPSQQQNGEDINLYNNQIGYCKVNYAYSQAQGKTNILYNTLFWGGTYTCISGADYGFQHGDGATPPIVNIVNLAGINRQLMNIYCNAFSASFSNIYGEGLLKIGSAGGPAGCSFYNFQADFQNSSPGFPSPDFYVGGPSISWYGPMLRLYDGTGYHRLVLNYSMNWFNGGSIGSPPIVTPVQAAGGGYDADTAEFTHVTIYYQGRLIRSNSYDSQVYIGYLPVHVNRQDFSGYIIDGNPSLLPGETLTTQMYYQDQNKGIYGRCVTVGYIPRKSLTGDTVYLENVGVGIHDGDMVAITDNKIK